MPSDFIRKLKTLESTIWAYARHYEIHGVLEEEDLYQEGLIELDHMVNLEQYRDLPDKTFSSYFKTRLSNKYIKRIKHHTRAKRNWKNTVFFDNIERIIYDKDTVHGRFPVADTHMFNGTSVAPDIELENEQKEQEAKEFFSTVREGLDEEARWVFDQLMFGVVPDQIKGEFQRVPTHISTTVLGLIFAWDRQKAWRVLKRVRDRCETVIRQKLNSGDSVLWNEANTRNIIKRR